MSFDLTKEFTCPGCPAHTPREAYFFIPTKEDEVVINPGNPNIPRRKIFEKKNIEEYTDIEKEKYSEFESFYKSNREKLFEIPSTWKRTDIMKCIQSSNYNIQKSVDKIKSIIDFDMPSLPYESYEEILHSGFLYMHGLDDHYRPIIVTNASVYMKLSQKFQLEHFLCAIDSFMKYLSKHIFIPGQVENWVMIGDLTGVSMFKPPISMLKIFNFLMIKYLCRLHVLYIYGMNSILNFCWKIVRKMVDEGTAKKFIFN